MIVHTPIGSIKGIEKNGIIHFPAMPYAVSNRYEICKMVDSISSSSLSSACPQLIDEAFNQYFGHDLLKDMPFNENCQLISINRPLRGKSFPVMIWIHGGGYVGGCGDAIGFDSSLMVKENDVLVVHVTYRLGLWGFIGGFNDIPSNLGFLDVITALKWIKKYIHFFGGDDENITLFGQSAGGDLIAHLMACHETEHLFQRVIIQSAPFGLRKNRGAVTEKLIEIAKISNLQGTMDELLDVQRKMLKNAQKMGLQSGMPFGVQYGELPLPPESKIESEWRKRAKEVDVLVGYNKHETSVFLNAFDALNKYLKLPIIGGLLRALVVMLTTHKVYAKGARDFHYLIKNAGGHSTLYHFNFGSKTNALKSAHTMELPLLFWNKAVWGNALLLKDIPNETIETESHMLRKIWCDFAKTGEVHQSPSKKLIRFFR
ncbi:carboxylesterase family protein [Fusibacter paucivorans]|uniref:Carboxylic ester hydrolase n=1 Tax=Fusibacter paucivorans TaxID=76009 RepID=A0ABS5PU74_9FIRM|nr:carboxylesterase family protein [Fusibacter paucivorans]MBS7528719.1 carboxylesterase family protein [Fusibacter paucivorans]